MPLFALVNSFQHVQRYAVPSACNDRRYESSYPRKKTGTRLYGRRIGGRKNLKRLKGLGTPEELFSSPFERKGYIAGLLPDGEAHDGLLERNRIELFTPERLPSWRQGGNSSPPPPPNRISKVEHSDAGSLQVSIPSRGPGTDSLFAGTFSVAWFSVIAPATFLGGAPLLFLPFWVAGGLVAKTAIVDPWLSTNLRIGTYTWSLERKYVGKTIQTIEGSTSELRCVTSESAAIVNGVPQFELRLYSEKGGVTFGAGLAPQELDYLVHKINTHIMTIQS